MARPALGNNKLTVHLGARAMAILRTQEAYIGGKRPAYGKILTQLIVDTQNETWEKVREKLGGANSGIGYESVLKKGSPRRNRFKPLGRV